MADICNSLSTICISYNQNNIFNNIELYSDLEGDYLAQLVEVINQSNGFSVSEIELVLFNFHPNEPTQPDLMIQYIWKGGKGMWGLGGVPVQASQFIRLLGDNTIQPLQNLQQTLDVGNVSTTGMVIHTPSGNQSVIFPGVVEVGNSDLSVEVAITPGVVRVVDTSGGNEDIVTIEPFGISFSPNSDVYKMQLSTGPLTNNQSASFQNASGVIAYLSDIPTVTTPSLEEVIAVNEVANSTPDFRGGLMFRQNLTLVSGVTGNIFQIIEDSGVGVIEALGSVGYNFSTLGVEFLRVSQDTTSGLSGIGGTIDATLLTDSRSYQLPNKSGIFALLDDIPSLIPVSSSQSGIVNNTSLQELGGVDKLINGQRIGRGPGNIATNTVFGSGVMSTNTTGNNITAIGTAALAASTTANANTAVGAYALYVNQTGINNTALGNFALQNTTAANNTALGYGAGAANTSGIRNTIVGTGAQIVSTTASNNTTIGAAAGQNNTTGGSNVFVGWMAGGNTTTGAGNVIIGTQGTVGTGISTGSNNLIIGPNAGNGTGITTGSGNVVVGKVTGLTAASTNTINIADGVGNIMFRKLQTGEILAPALTPTLINSGGNSSLITKEYLDSTIATIPYIPLSGTLLNFPITGDLELSGNRSLFKTNTFDQSDSITFSTNHIEIIRRGEWESSFQVSDEGVYIYSDNPISKGLFADQDFSPNYDALSYIQKTYVDSNFVLVESESTFSQPIIADGIENVFTFPHGMSDIPGIVIVTRGVSSDFTVFGTTWDATNVTITFMTPPVAGTVNLNVFAKL